MPQISAFQCLQRLINKAQATYEVNLKPDPEKEVRPIALTSGPEVWSATAMMQSKAKGRAKPVSSDENDN